MVRRSSPRLLAGIVALVAAAAFAAGCGSDGSSSGGSGGTTASGGSGGSGGTEPRVAALVYVLNDYTSVELDTLKAGLKSAGGTVDVLSANFDPQKQLAQCQDAITSGRFNALVVDAVDSPSAVPCAKQAGAAGLKVIAMENPIGPSRTEVAPQLDDVQGSSVIYPLDDAKHTFELVRKACEGVARCQWVIEIGALSSPLDSTKLKYLKERAAATDNIEVVQVVQGNYDPSVTVKSAPDVLSSHPDLNVWTFESDTNAVAAIPAVKAAGMADQVKLIGDGGSRAGAAAIKAGTMYGSVAAFPASQAEAAAKMVIDAVNGTEIAEPAVSMFTLGTPVELTAETIGDYTSQWGAKG